MLLFGKIGLSSFVVERPTVCLGDNGECAVKGVGKIRIENFVNGTWREGVIEDVFYVPSVKRNLFSVGVCTKQGQNDVKFKGSSVKVERNGQIVATGAKQSNQIFRMFFHVQSPRNEVNVSVTTIKVWHKRLGHINQRSLCVNMKRTN